jgi:hypothetical protein
VTRSQAPDAKRTAPRGGPRSAAGRKRASRNAVKHGLAIPVFSDPDCAPEISKLADKIAGGRHELLDLATSVAEAQLQVERVRRARAELINDALRNPQPPYRATVAFVKFLSRVLDAAETGRLSPADQERLLAWSKEKQVYIVRLCVAGFGKTNFGQLSAGVNPTATCVCLGCLLAQLLGWSHRK